MSKRNSIILKRMLGLIPRKVTGIKTRMLGLLPRMVTGIIARPAQQGGPGQYGCEGHLGPLAP